jgi:hypothetical protein
MVSKNRNWQHHLSGIRPRLIAEFDKIYHESLYMMPHSHTQIRKKLKKKEEFYQITYDAGA